jgi:hypothetical protein
VRAISLCSFPCAAKSFAWASFAAISALECFFFLAMAACVHPPMLFGFANSNSTYGRKIVLARKDDQSICA